VLRHYLLTKTHAPWYAGRLGLTVRVGDLRLTMPDRHLAGVLRLGGYERPERIAVRQFLRPELPVIDIGAGVGVVSCVANRRLPDPTRHRSIEANPNAVQLLTHNRDQNGCGFQIIHAALGYTDSVTMAVDARIVSSRASDDGVEVPVTSLANVAVGWERFSLICDIEGGEIDLMRHEADLLATRVDTLIIERHPLIVGADADARLHRDLLVCGLRQKWRKGAVYVYQR
jgi:FkbM family methyltransferase